MCGVTPRLPFTSSLTRWSGTRMPSASSRCVSSIGRRNSASRISPGCVGAQCVGIRSMVTNLAQVIVDDFDLIRARGCPHEAHAILVVDAKAMLSHPIPLQRFPMVGRWGPQIIPRRGGIQPLQLPARDLPQQRGAGLASSLRIDTVEAVLGARTSERANHHSVSAWGSCYRNRERASGVTTAHQPRRHEVRPLLACALGQKCVSPRAQRPLRALATPLE